MSGKKKNSAKNKTEETVKVQPKKNNLPLILTAVGIVCVAVVAVIIGGGLGNSAEIPDTGSEIASGGYLTILTAEIGSAASFYPITVDGMQMEVLAVRASDGTIRTAFNTCQNCYTSGAGYYVQQGDDLVCQNCGFHFTPDQVEIQSGGCNPWPIFTENKTVTEDEIQISYDFLKEAKAIFANWKR